MNLTKRLKGQAIAAWLGPTGDAARRAIAQVKKSPARVDFYHDPADALSYLATQALQRLVKTYNVDFTITVVAPPASDVNPEPAMRNTNSARDAIELAAFWDLEFPGKKSADPNVVKKAGAIQARKRAPAEQLAAVLQSSEAMWRNDQKLLFTAAGQWGNESQVTTDPTLNAAYARLRKAGHYEGASFCYRGQWYVGVDRLHYLEAAIAADAGRPVAGVLQRRGNVEPRLLSKNPLAADFWFSFRSPYSYIALMRLQETLGRDIPVRLRPMMPMVSRGVPLARIKQNYILLDAAREAARHGLAFGNICDPLGKGIDHCMGIAKWAETRSAADAMAFAQSAMRGIWTEARDMADYVDLKYVVERAGLPWEQAKTAALDPQTASWSIAAAADLAVFGLWGVPALRVGDLTVWGQDRFDLVKARLEQHRRAVEQASHATTEADSGVPTDAVS
jgi:2-hydroxychromene-2-carboxylate isomerase